MTIGNRIFLKRPACSVDLLKEFEQLPAANIADTMNRIAVLGNGIKRISKPGLRKYAGVKDLPRVRGGLGTAIVSTSQGVMADRDARKKGIGGEVIALIW